MTRIAMIDDSEGPAKNMEVSRACTVLELPKMEVYGIRLYHTDSVDKYNKSRTEILDKASAQRLNIKKIKNDESKLDSFKGRIKEFDDARALIAAYPRDLNVGQHHPMRFESNVGGKSIEEKFEFLTKNLGKEIRATDAFKPGEFVDVMSISIGKGWAGVMKRYHHAKRGRKNTAKVRHGGVLGTVVPAKVIFSMGRAGQMGFNYRTEHNKRILRIGAKADSEAINKPGGFKNYGVVNNDYMLIDGSVPGPAKRLVRVRKSIRARNAKGIKEPKINYIAKD